MFTKSIGTRVFYHASIASTQSAPNTDDEIKLENQLIHSNTPQILLWILMSIVLSIVILSISLMDQQVTIGDKLQEV